MLNKLHGQPESYDKKYFDPDCSRNTAKNQADQNISLDEPSALVPMELSEKRMAQLERSPWRLSSRRMSRETSRWSMTSWRCCRGWSTHISSSLWTGSNQECVVLSEVIYMVIDERRINTTLSPSWRQEENCSTEFARKEDLPKRMLLSRFDKFLKLSTIYMTTMSFTEVGMDAQVLHQNY